MRAWSLVAGSESLCSQREVFLGRDASGRGAKLYKVQSCREGSKNFILALDGVRWRDEAEGLKGMHVFVRSEDLPELEDSEEYYLYELKGLEVVSVEGEYIGYVHDMVETSAVDSLIIRERGDTEVMVPFVEDIVREVDMDAKRLVLDPPEGLLEATREPASEVG
jgi:16S rRNA processing protein RimM